MKTRNYKSKVLIFLLIAFGINGFSQIIGTKIDVQGKYYSDQMWIFSMPTTMQLENGCNGLKVIGASSAPQIYAVETDGNYQVQSISEFKNITLSFKAGIDTSYTMTFTNQNLAQSYQKLYLIDSVANKTVDIYKTGTKYLFIAKNSIPINRFRIVTSIDEIKTVKSNVIDSPEVIPSVTSDAEAGLFSQNIKQY